MGGVVAALVAGRAYATRPLRRSRQTPSDTARDRGEAVVVGVGRRRAAHVARYAIMAVGRIRGRTAAARHPMSLWSEFSDRGRPGSDPRPKGRGDGEGRSHLL